jgi:uncharacterized protein YllA (UPF0747 family)
VLRTLYQELLLPNVAVMGGPSEVAYWLEYKKLFAHYKMPFPMLVLRACMMQVDSNSKGRLDKLGLQEEQLFETSDELTRQYLANVADDHLNFEQEKKLADALFENLVEKAGAAYTSLKAAAEAEKQKFLNGIKSLEEKIISTQKKKNETVVQQIHRMKDKFFPNGSIQERLENFIPYYLKYGPAFFEILLENINPLEKDFIIFEEVLNGKLAS